MALVVELAEDQLFVQPIHRLILGASGNFVGKLNVVADVEPMGANDPEGVRHLLAEMERTESFGPRRRSRPGPAATPPRGAPARGSSVCPNRCGRSTRPCWR